jgi:general secretion pathway protein M
MKQYLLKRKLIPVATIGFALVLCWLCGLYVFQKHQSVQNRLTDFIEPRYARLAGLRLSESALGTAAERARAMEMLYTYSSEQDANQSGNDAQQRVRSMLTTAGMTISSSQVLPPKDAHGIERIALSVRADGDLVSLHSALVGLAEMRPVVLVDSVNVQGSGVPERGVQRLSVQFSFLVLRRMKP